MTSPYVDHAGPDQLKPSPGVATMAATVSAQPRRTNVSAFRVMVALPVLAFLLGVIVTEGQYFGTLHSVKSLTTQVGHRLAAGDSATDRQQAAIDAVNAVIDSYPLLDREGIAVHVTDDALNPKQHEVTVTYNTRPIGLWILAGLAHRSSVTVHRSVTVRHQGQ